MTKKAKLSHQAVRRHFGNYEVVEADATMVLVPTEEDFQSAVPGDPASCVLAQTAKRAFGSTKVLVFQGFAYVDHVDEDGVRKVFRYCVRTRTYKEAIRFDKSGEFRTGVTFKFHPIRPSDTLKNVARINRKWRSSPSGKAIMAERTARKRLTDLVQKREQLEIKLADVSDPSVPKAAELQTELKDVKRELTVARREFDIRHAKAEAARTLPYRPSNRKRSLAEDNNLLVRNGRGYFRNQQTDTSAHPKFMD